MITSPTGKGVLLIGGHGGPEVGPSNVIYELSGDSIEELNWSVLDQKLKYNRYSHLSFSIPNEICDSNGLDPEHKLVFKFPW